MPLGEAPHHVGIVRAERVGDLKPGFARCAQLHRFEAGRARRRFGIDPAGAGRRECHASVAENLALAHGHRLVALRQLLARHRPHRAPAPDNVRPVRRQGVGCPLLPRFGKNDGRATLGREVQRGQLRARKLGETPQHDVMATLLQSPADSVGMNVSSVAQGENSGQQKPWKNY